MGFKKGEILKPRAEEEKGVGLEWSASLTSLERRSRVVGTMSRRNGDGIGSSQVSYVLLFL